MSYSGYIWDDISGNCIIPEPFKTKDKSIKNKVIIMPFNEDNETPSIILEGNTTKDLDKIERMVEKSLENTHYSQ